MLTSRPRSVKAKPIELILFSNLFFTISSFNFSIQPIVAHLICHGLLIDSHCTLEILTVNAHTLTQTPTMQL